MIDLDDGEQLMNLIGIVLMLLLIMSVAVLILTAMSAQQQSADIPDVDWNLTRINESYVRITHAGGEPVQTENLSVTVDGIPRQPQWTAPTLASGKYGIVAADEHSRVTLLWRESDIERVVLGRWHLTQS